jgi:nucleolar pre-ribosomal-associated protein 1
LFAGIHAFKAFLESIAYPKDNPDAVPAQRSILRTFLDSSIADGEEPEEKVLLPEVMKMWGFALQTNSDRLFTAVASVLALLLKALSMDLASREHGILLGKTVLQQEQLKLLLRGLSAPKHKDHIISPCLRLLTEVVSFDGGALASQVYTKRDFTFETRCIVRCLGLKRTSTDDATEDWRKPSVRANAIRYLLAHLRLQKEGPKIDIMKQGNIMRALFEHVVDDRPEIVADILQVTKKHIIQDTSMPRSSKSQMLTEHNLGNISKLYRRPNASADEDSQHKSLDVQAHEFLTFVCTTPNLGLLLPSSGWYPRDLNRLPLFEDRKTDGDDSIDLGLESLELAHRYDNQVPIRNVVLASFAQSLRPYSNMFEQELLLSIFKAAPELVADYFYKKEFFSFDPKLTSTWIGYAALLFSTIEQSIPTAFGATSENARIPPPVSIAMENILPRPLTQKVLTKCLNSPIQLVSFFAIRLLVVAFQKLVAVLDMFSEGSRAESALWQEAAEQIRSRFAGRCPSMKDIVAAFRKPNKEHVSQREAITRLLSLYYSSTPDVSYGEPLDISMNLIDSLATVEKMRAPSVEKEFRIMELSHLVRIAQHSPSMKWWNKPQNLPFTPFTTLLRLVSSPDHDQYADLADLVGSIVEQNNLLQLATGKSALEVLITSLRQCSQDLESDAIFDFLDNCLSRFVRKPIKYLDQIEALKTNSESQCQNPTSPLVAALAEQWLFIAEDVDDSKVVGVGTWLARFLAGLKCIGEDPVFLDAVSTNISGTTQVISFKTLIQGFFQDSVSKEQQNPTTQNVSSDIEGNPTANGVLTAPESMLALEALKLDAPEEESESHPELTRWLQKDLEEAVMEGHVAQLLRAFSSKHVSIRIQALTNVRKLMQRLEQSNYEERDQIYLLLAEFIETAQDAIHSGPLAPVASVFAGHAVAVLADPGHFLYPKVNRFLNKAPIWDVDRIPSYWAGKILLDEPNEDDGFHRETSWLLDLFYDSLQTAQDMEIFRARNIFERVLALYTLPTSRKAAREKILKLISRAIAIGGSTTLVTRAGILDWLQVQLGRADGNEAMLHALRTHLEKRYDADKVAAWSGGRLGRQ